MQRIFCSCWVKPYTKMCSNYLTGRVRGRETEKLGFLFERQLFIYFFSLTVPLVTQIARIGDRLFIQKP